MLSYISAKFSQEIPAHVNEPRAALFLNRFSRTLAIMYATNGLADVLGITADRLVGKSFYFCIQENCLREAVKCLESAKANDSIAYLRFWFRDPTTRRRQNSARQDEDDHMADDTSSGDDEDGGVYLSELMDHDANDNAIVSDSSNSMRSSTEPHHASNLDPNSRSSSGDSADLGGLHDNLFDPPVNGQSRTSSVSTPDGAQSSSDSWAPEEPQIELEAVVSCTSDGLVVVLRRAKPFFPHIATAVANSAKLHYSNGLFASPWANDPVLPFQQYDADPLPGAMRPDPTPAYATALSTNNPAKAGGPASEDFMNSIREVAVFAWSLTGINGSLHEYGRGTAFGESVPPDGYPVWDPDSNAGPEGYSSGDRLRNGDNRGPLRGRSVAHHAQGSGSQLNGNLGFQGPHSLTSLSTPGSRHLNGNNIAPTGALTDGHSSNGTNGYHDGQQMDDVQHDQGTVYSSASKATYNAMSPKHVQAPASYGQNSTNGLSNGNQSTEYDPYAPPAYQASVLDKHDTFAQPSTANGWHVNPIVPPQSNGYHH